LAVGGSLDLVPGLLGQPHRYHARSLPFCERFCHDYSITLADRHVKS
jgi:hypothetical protein